jgi:hypothetical protein
VAVCISTIDRDAHNALPPDAAGNVCPGTGNLTVRNRKRRARRRFAAAGFGYNRNIPKTVIGRLGERRSGGKRSGGESKKRKSDAMIAHESKSPNECDDAAYSGTLCPNFAAPRQHQKFPANQTFNGEAGSTLGTDN